jgi:serine/threonine protein kinase/Leucine-rich repeat (LRR) protein
MPEPTDKTNIEPSGANSEGSMEPTLQRPDDAPVLLHTSTQGGLIFGPPQNAGELGTFGRYRVLKKIGQGGMGTVFLGYDSSLERKIALKVMLPQYAVDRDSRERFLREARSAAKVRSDHVVTIFDVGEIGGVPFIAMEYLLGAPMDSYLRTKGELPLSHVLRVCRETATGLSAAHTLGLVHRDIKPGNIWLESPKGRVKLLDFGLARTAKEDVQITHSGAVIGTPAYMSPEQGRGLKVDARSDLFSLGVMMYRLATGKLPFTGDTTMAVLTSLAVDTPIAPRVHNPALPAAVETVILKLLEKKPEARFQTATEVAEAIASLESGMQAGPLPAIVAMPVQTMMVGAQTQNVWEDVLDSGSVAVPLATQSEATEHEPKSSAKPRRATPERQVSKLPLYVAGAVFVVACVVLAAVLWPKKPKDDVAQNDDNKQQTDKKKDPPKVAIPPDRKAAEWALSVGGKVTIFVNGQTRELRKGDTLPKEPFALHGLSVAQIITVGNTDLAALHDCRSLLRLEIDDTSVTDAGLEHLTSCHSLEFLSLVRNKITDAGVAHLKKCPQLKSLIVDQTAISDTSLQHLATNDKLESLSIATTQVTEPGVRVFAKSHPSCRVIWSGGIIEPVWNDPVVVAKWLLEKKKLTRIGITVRGKHEFVEVLPKEPFTVTTLDFGLNNQGKIDDDEIPRLAVFKDLQTLSLNHQSVTDAGFAKLAGLKELQRLNVYTTKLTDASIPVVLGFPKLQFFNGISTDPWMEALARAPALREMTIYRTSVSDQGIAALLKYPHLERLQLSDCQISDAGYNELTKLTRLRSLVTYDVAVKYLDAIATALPNCEIQYVVDNKPVMLQKGADRKAAEWVISVGGFIGVTAAKDVIKDVKDLPKEPFDLMHVHLWLIRITDDNLALFSNCPQLKTLHLGLTGITDAGVAHLKTCKSITNIDLAANNLTDVTLQHLRALPQLNYLYITKTKVTKDGIAALAKDYPQCTITWDGGKIDPLSPRNDRDAAIAVLTAGGSVSILGGEGQVLELAKLPAGPLVLRAASLRTDGKTRDAVMPAIVALAGCKDLSSLGLTGPQIQNADLAPFAACKKLTSLNLSGTSITDDGVAHFKECFSLRVVQLQHTKCTEAALTTIQNWKQLDNLSLRDLPITDTGLDLLTGLPLTTLDLRGTKVTLAKMTAFAKAHPRCRVTHDTGTIEPTNKTERDLAEWVISVEGFVNVNGEIADIRNTANLPKQPFTLTGINLSVAKEKDDNALAQFQNVKTLQRIALSRTLITDKGLAYLAGNKNLKYLWLPSTQVTDAGLGHFKDCKELILIDLASTPITDTGLAIFKDFEKLTTIRLIGTQITDAGLRAFTGTKALELIELQKTKVTAEGVAEFAKRNPRCKVVWDGGTIEPAGGDDRDAVLALLNAGAGVKVEDAAGKQAEVFAVTELPNGKLKLMWLNERPMSQIDDALLAKCAGCKHLQYAHLNRSKVTDAGLVHVKQAQFLTSLELADTAITDAGLKHLATHELLVNVNLAGTKITNDGLASLTSPRLGALNLERTAITDKGLSQLKGPLELRSLLLKDTAITDAGLDILKENGKLTWIDLRGTKVTVAKLNEIAKLMPKCKFLHDGGTIEPAKK